MRSSFSFDIEFRDELTGIKVYMWENEVQDWEFEDGPPRIQPSPAEIDYIQAEIFEAFYDF